jgi:hypothetical protein
MSNFGREAALRAPTDTGPWATAVSRLSAQNDPSLSGQEDAGNISVASATDLVHRTQPWEDRHMLPNTLAEVLMLPASHALRLRQPAAQPA